MASEVWLGFNEAERRLLRQALSAYWRDEAADRDVVNALVKKIANAPPHPDITIGVYGGVVQWVMGNPFPIRICDYDGDDDELPDMDERGQPCTMGFEEADPSLTRAA